MSPPQEDPSQPVRLPLGTWELSSKQNPSKNVEPGSTLTPVRVEPMEMPCGSHRGIMAALPSRPEMTVRSERYASSGLRQLLRTKSVSPPVGSQIRLLPAVGWPFGVKRMMHLFAGGVVCIWARALRGSKLSMKGRTTADAPTPSISLRRETLTVTYASSSFAYWLTR